MKGTVRSIDSADPFLWAQSEVTVCEIHYVPGARGGGVSRNTMTVGIQRVFTVSILARENTAPSMRNMT